MEDVHTQPAQLYAVALSASFPAQQMELISSAQPFLQILIITLMVLSLAICINVCLVHNTVSLWRAEVGLRIFVTQTATREMQVTSR